MKGLKVFGAFILGIMVSACNNEQSLQEYYVNNQGNKDFIAIDLPASMLTNMSAMDENQRRTLETIRKINILAISKKPENQARIETEKQNVGNILNNEKYELLMKFGGGTTKMELYFTGDEEAIDEFILYGHDENKGMAVARILGDNMNPGDIINLVRSFEKGDVNIPGMEGMAQMFGGNAQ